MKIETKQNFISVDKKTVRNSYGEFFTVGEIVGHENLEVGEATILVFEPDMEQNEVKAHTNKGWCHIDFLNKLESKVYPENTDKFYDLERKFATEN